MRGKNGATDMDITVPTMGVRFGAPARKRLDYGRPLISVHNIHAALSHKMGQRGCDPNGWTSPIERYLSMFKSHVAYALDQRAGLGKNNNLVPKVPHRTSQLQGIISCDPPISIVCGYTTILMPIRPLSPVNATGARILGKHPRKSSPQY